MRKIRIIKNGPPEENGYSDITQYVGQEFDIPEDKIFNIDPTGNEATGVFIEELDIEVYDGEFEFID